MTAWVAVQTAVQNTLRWRSVLGTKVRWAPRQLADKLAKRWHGQRGCWTWWRLDSWRQRAAVLGGDPAGTSCRCHTQSGAEHGERQDILPMVIDNTNELIVRQDWKYSRQIGVENVKSEECRILHKMQFEISVGIVDCWVGIMCRIRERGEEVGTGAAQLASYDHRCCGKQMPCVLHFFVSRVHSSLQVESMEEDLVRMATELTRQANQQPKRIATTTSQAEERAKVGEDVKGISPIQENSMQYGYDENDNNNMSDETKCETNYSINNKWNNTRNKHLTKHDTNDDVDLDNCVVHTVR